MAQRLELSPRVIGALVAAGLGVAATAAQLALGLPVDPRLPGTMIVPVFVPVGVLLGFRYAERIVRSRSLPLRTICRIAVQALLVGAILIAAVTALTDSYGPLPPDLGGFLGRLVFFAAYGVVLLGVPLFFVSVVYTAVWAVLIRRFARS